MDWIQHMLLVRLTGGQLDVHRQVLVSSMISKADYNYSSKVDSKSGMEAQVPWRVNRVSPALVKET